MRVFLSWSGNTSKAVAEELQKWLPQVIQAVDPWISVDIEKGSRWSSEISSELEKSKVSIICLTRDNLNEAWILYEAGALSKNTADSLCTFLLDLKHTDVTGPLAQFQHTQFNKDDVRKLLRKINKAVYDVGERSLGDKELDDIFNEFHWPKLEKKLNEILKKQKTNLNVPKRDTENILEEILQTVRMLNQQYQDIKYDIRREFLNLADVPLDDLSTEVIENWLFKSNSGKAKAIREKLKKIIRDFTKPAEKNDVGNPGIISPPPGYEWNDKI